MKARISVCLLWLGTCAWALGASGTGGLGGLGAAQQGKYVAVKISDFDKKETYQVMSEQEFKDLQKEIRAEASLFPKAVENARMAWSKDEKLKGKIFPKSAISLRKADQMGTAYSDADKAQKKVDGYMDAEDKRLSRKEAVDKQRESNQRRATRGQYSPPTQTKQAKDREKEKEDLILKAIDLVRQELDKLKAGAPAPADGKAPAGGDVKVEAAPAGK